MERRPMNDDPFDKWKPHCEIVHKDELPHKLTIYRGPYLIAEYPIWSYKIKIRKEEENGR